MENKMQIKLLKKYRGVSKGETIEADNSELEWLAEFGYIDNTVKAEKVTNTKASTETKKRNTRKPRKAKRS
jgi:hypothetical protein